MRNFQKAFSIIEVIFVLVILGIVASISSQILAQVYENYIIQRAVYNVSTKTELAVNQIVNLLTYRIQGTTISKNHVNMQDKGDTLEWLPLRDVQDAGNIYTSIEWIGYDNDSLSATAKPAWSGVAYYYKLPNNTPTFKTPGSNLYLARTIMKNLSNGKVELTNTKPAAVLFLQKDNQYTTGANPFYSPECMGLIPSSKGGTTDCIFPVSMDDNQTLRFTDATQIANPTIISERYKLAWSAYTITPESNGKPGLFDLILYSNYQPWNGETNIDNGTRSIIIRNISVFKFSEQGGVIRFKLCAIEQIGADHNVSACKEKAIIR